MSIGSINTSAALSAVSSGNMGEIGVKMLSKALDQQSVEGAGLQKMMASAAEMERSVNPAVGGNFDMSV